MIPEDTDMTRALARRILLYILDLRPPNSFSLSLSFIKLLVVSHWHHLQT